MERAAKWLAVAATVGMFIVLLMGATVTNTGSSEGCGKSWPLCHGEFIPEYAFETMVEYSHRLVTGVEGLLILGMSVTAFPLRRRYPELKALIPLTLFTLVLQSGMGAWAVKYPQTPPVMASHFGISLVCFASVFLVMRVLWETTPISAAATRAVPSGYRTSGLGYAALGGRRGLHRRLPAPLRRGARLLHVAALQWLADPRSLEPRRRRRLEPSPGGADRARRWWPGWCSGRDDSRRRARISTASVSGPPCSSSPRRPPVPSSSSPASRWQARSATPR